MSPQGDTHWQCVVAPIRYVGAVPPWMTWYATVSDAETETESTVSEQVTMVFNVAEAVTEQVRAVADPFLNNVTETVCADPTAVSATETYSTSNVHAAGMVVCTTP